MVLDYASVPLPDGNTLLTYRRRHRHRRHRERAARARRGAGGRRPAQDQLPVQRLLRAADAAHQHHRLFRGAVARHRRRAAAEAARISAAHPGRRRSDLLAIIDAILDLTTIDAGAMELKLALIDVAELMQSTADGAAEAIEQARPHPQYRDRRRCGELHRRPQAGPPDPVQPALQCHRLFGCRGDDPMGARRDGDQMLLWVSDTGRGIEPGLSEAGVRALPGAADLGRPSRPGARAVASSRASSSCMAGRFR